MHLSFWHPVDFFRDEREHCESCHPHVSIFLEFRESWVTTLFLLPVLSSFGSASAQGKSMRNVVSEVTAFIEIIKPQPPVRHWQMLQSGRPDGSP
jgi:hypothetical protein